MSATTTENKVKYGLKNVYIAKQTTTVSEGVTTYTYGTPKALKGAVNLSLDPEGEQSIFYADNIAYYISNDNNGYKGDLEVAMIPDWFRTDILNETTVNGCLVEDANTEASAFALLFEFNGDVKATRHVIYNCVCGRPKVEGKTKEASTDPTTETLSITSTPREDGKNKAKTTASTSETVYNSWYTTVFVPTASAGA